MNYNNNNTIIFIIESIIIIILSNLLIIVNGRFIYPDIYRNETIFDDFFHTKVSNFLLVPLGLKKIYFFFIILICFSFQVSN